MSDLSRRLIELAFSEDIAWGDITTSLLVPSDMELEANFIAKESMILAGMPFVKDVFSFKGIDYQLNIHKQEGSSLTRGDIIATIKGNARHLLECERLALNILQRVSGIATLTRMFVDKVKGLPVRVVDTRKTTPAMRLMEKYGVRIGGGYNHRFCLADGILIKDNHIKAIGSLKEAVKCAKMSHHLIKIEVETTNLNEVREALDSGADVIMLDNMTIEEMKEAVRLINKRVIVEASGNVTLDNIRDIAQTGVDIISLGAITHSAKAVDISMKFV
ncbi:MAG: carboxylating nicotinate-nucleotide diphosphorylase [Thermodesulfovibrionales bacterium]|nr:carboxylating nicotinate-nucleotide diphosphorylase [Thermodesulfovibrionales bacterium]